MNSDKILITGATGFIGGHLAEALIKKYHVKALVRETSNTQKLKKLGVELVYGDLRNLDSLKKAIYDIGIVYHLAEAKGSPQKAYEIDVKATRALIDYSQSAGVTRFVYASTVAVMGRSQETPLDESRQYNPYPFFFHALAKCECEKYGFDKFKEEKFPFVAIRPSGIYGGNCPYINFIFEWMRKHPLLGVPVLGNGKNTMHFAHIDDIVKAFELAGERKEAIGNAYIIVDDCPISWNEFLEATANSLHIKLRLRRIPVLPIMLLGGFIESISKLMGNPIVIKPVLYFFTDNVSYSNFKAKHDLGFKPKYPDPIKGLEKEMKLCKNKE